MEVKVIDIRKINIDKLGDIIADSIIRTVSKQSTKSLS